MDQPLRFEIAPAPGESARGCGALLVSAIAKARARGTFLFVGLCALVGLLAAVVPPSRASSFLVGLIAVYASIYGVRALGRRNLRALQETDPHALETYFVEIGPLDVYAGCAHVNARYAWEEFTKVTESTEFYLFVRKNGGGVALPKRILDASKEQELRDRIREWAPDRGSGLPRERAMPGPSN